MTEPLPPDRDPELSAIVQRLQAERPVPHPGFRGELRRRLVATPARRSRPARVKAAIAAYAGSGLGLLAVAAIGLAGVGPFAA